MKNRTSRFNEGTIRHTPSKTHLSIFGCESLRFWYLIGVTSCPRVLRMLLFLKVVSKIPLPIVTYLRA